MIKEVVVGIHQPNFLPWIGYFYKILKSDIFVFLDNVQFTKNSFQNRVKIKTKEGAKWLTLPILHNFGQLTKDVLINNNEKWREKHLKTLEANYRKTPFYKEIASFIQGIYFHKEWTLMTELNIKLLTDVCECLSIKTKFILASSLNVKGTSTDLLINIIKKVNGNIYLSGKGGANYQQAEAFSQAGINLVYTDFKHPTYPQYWSDFSQGLSIIDYLFNCGNTGFSEIFSCVTQSFD
jgi:hypothetical protein